jgi:hypothetical protein
MKKWGLILATLFFIGTLAGSAMAWGGGWDGDGKDGWFDTKGDGTTTTTLPDQKEIPEFPTTAIPALVAVGGYLAIRRLNRKE